MPVDMNDYFKKGPKSGGGSSGGNGGGGDNKTPEFIRDFGKKAGAVYVIIAILLIVVLAKPFVIVHSGEVGIRVNLGKYEDTPLLPGFHLLIPFVQKAIIVDTKIRVTNYSTTERRVSKKFGTDETQTSINQRKPISILDERGLPVEVELTVQYRLRPEIIPATFASIGGNWEEKIITPNTTDVVRSVIGNYTAEELPTQRNNIATLIEQGMKKRLDALDNKPIELEAIQLRGIMLPQKIREQIERVQIAKQEEQRARNEVERTKQEAFKKQEEARGIAEAKRIEAKGIADKVAIEAKAQARANELIAKSLTSNLIKLKQIEVQGKFNEALKENNNAQIFLTPGGSVPNIWLDSKSTKRNSSASK